MRISKYTTQKRFLSSTTFCKLLYPCFDLSTEGYQVIKFLGSKEHLGWLKINLNAAEIITTQDYKCTKNKCEWKYTYTVIKLRVEQVTYVPKI